MGHDDFTYSIPDDFERRVNQILQQVHNNSGLAKAFKECRYEYEDLGNAYYAGIKSDNWNMDALDFTIEGPARSIEVLEKSKDVLKDVISKGLRSRTSGLQVRNVFLLATDGVDPLPVSSEARLNVDIETARSVLVDLISTCERLCLNSTYSYDCAENSMNDYLRDMLSSKGYIEVKDQTRHGLSGSGRDSGEVDILISKSGKEIALIECLKLGCVNTSSIDEHIQKAICNYNALGTATFIVSYVYTADFGVFWSKYVSYLETYDFKLEMKGKLSEEASPDAATRIASVILSRDGFDFPVYFLALKLSR